MEAKLYFDGEKMHIQGKRELIEWLKTFGDDNWFELTINPIGNINTTAQQKLYWTWCDIIHQEFGWDSSKEVHSYFKETYNNSQSTKGFDTKQWAEYMNKVQAFAHQNDIKLPTGKLN